MNSNSYTNRGHKPGSPERAKAPRLSWRSAKVYERWVRMIRHRRSKEAALA